MKSKKTYLFLFITILLSGALAMSIAQEDKSFDELVFKDASLRSVIKYIGREANTNYVIDPNVSGKVSLELKDIKLKDVMEILKQTYNLITVDRGNYVRVLYREDYHKERVADKNWEDKRKELADLETKIVKIQNAKAQQISSSIKEALTDRGKIAIDERTNSLIIQDVPGNMDKIQKYVERFDQQTSLIKISARYMLIDSDFLREIGVSWKATQRDQKGQGEEMEVESATNQVADKLGNFKWGILSGDFNINATISAVKSNSKGKIVDNPQIVTLDNQEATIFSGEQVPVTTLDKAGNTVTQMFNTGTRLKVTPHITSQDRVLLSIECERSAYQPAAAGGKFSILTREASTNLIVDNKATVVMGGLKVKQTQIEDKGVPWLKDIPLIGNLFEYNSKSISTSDLVFFITPKILGKSPGE